MVIYEDAQWVVFDSTIYDHDQWELVEYKLESDDEIKYRLEDKRIFTSDRHVRLRFAWRDGLRMDYDFWMVFYLDSSRKKIISETFINPSSPKDYKDVFPEDDELFQGVVSKVRKIINDGYMSDDNY